MSLPAVSKHLKVLERAGLITRGRDAQMRPCRIDATGAEGGRRLARGVSPALGRAARPPRRLSPSAAGASTTGHDRTTTANRPSDTSNAKGEATWRQEIASISTTTRARSSARACSTRRASWSSRSGPIRSIWRSGGDRTASRTTTHAFDFRPGGVWRFVMHGPDGRDYQNRITFDEIVPPGAHRLSPRRRRRRRAGAVHAPPSPSRISARRDPADLARHVPVGRGARARHQGIRRRQGPRRRPWRGSPTTWWRLPRSVRRCPRHADRHASESQRLAQLVCAGAR